MTDICRDNGKSYFQEYKSKDGFIGYDEPMKIKKNRDQFCKSIPNTKAIMEEITEKCREPYFDKEEYNELLYAEQYYCATTDSKTGKHCDEVLDTFVEGDGWFNNDHYEKPPFNEYFRNWDPSLCDNSCIADLYPAILDLIKNQDGFGSSEFRIGSSYFKNYTDNPPNCCGTDDGSIGADTQCKADITFVKNLPDDFINGETTGDFFNSNSSSRHNDISKIDDAESKTILVVMEGLLGGFFFLMWAIPLIIFIILVVSLWKIFTKAGEEGWKAIIPFYNTYILFKITWEVKYFWWIIGIAAVSGICLFIPFIGWLVDFAGGIALLVITVISNYYLARSFGHEIGFTLGLIFLYPIFILVLAFSSTKYIGNGYELHKKEKAIINQNIVNQSTNVV